MVDAIRSKLPAIARTLLGLIFFVFGLNGFLQFMPMPPHPEAADAFLGALAATGYMFPLIKGTEVVAGLMLLGGRFVPLALVLLAPIIVNIAFFHLVLAPGVVMVVALLALELYLAWAYRDAFRGVLNPNAAHPTHGGPPLRGRSACRGDLPRVVPLDPPHVLHPPRRPRRGGAHDPVARRPRLPRDHAISRSSRSRLGPVDAG